MRLSDFFDRQRLFRIPAKYWMPRLQRSAYRRLPGNATEMAARATSALAAGFATTAAADRGRSSFARGFVAGDDFVSTFSEQDSCRRAFTWASGLRWRRKFLR